VAVHAAPQAVSARDVATLAVHAQDEGGGLDGDGDALAEEKKVRVVRLGQDPGPEAEGVADEQALGRGPMRQAEAAEQVDDPKLPRGLQEAAAGDGAHPTVQLDVQGVAAGDCGEPKARLDGQALCELDTVHSALVADPLLALGAEPVVCMGIAVELHRNLRVQGRPSLTAARLEEVHPRLREDHVHEVLEDCGQKPQRVGHLTQDHQRPVARGKVLLVDLGWIPF